MTQEFAIQYLDTSIARTGSALLPLFTVNQSTSTTAQKKHLKGHGHQGVVWDSFDHALSEGTGVDINGPDRLADVVEGVDWKYRKLARLPSDDKMRPSTARHTNTPIRVAHRVGAEIRFRFNGAPEKAMQITQKVHIVSVGHDSDPMAD